MKAARTPADRFRRQQLGAIHAEAKRLRFDETMYRSLLMRVAGVNSARDLDAKGRSDVLRAFAAFNKARTAAEQMLLPNAPQNVREEISAMIGKTAALLAEADRGWNYVHGMAKRMFGAARVEWLHADQLHKLVAALRFDQQRRRKRL